MLLFFAAVFLTIALAQFDPTEAPGSDALGRVSGTLGRAGSSAAYWVIVLTFGRFGAFAVPLALMLSLAGRWMNRRLLLRLTCAVVLAGFFIGFITAFARDWAGLVPDVLPSGFGPLRLLELSLSALQRWGTLIVTLAILTALAVLLADIRFTASTRWIFYSAPVAVFKILIPLFKARRVDTMDDSEAQAENDDPKNRIEVVPVEAAKRIPTPIAKPVDDGAVARAFGVRELPPLRLLDPPPADRPMIDHAELEENSRRLEDKLAKLGITARVVRTIPGPIITRYDLEPSADVKVARIAGLADDIAMALRARGVRILAPIPGEAAVGIEIPNRAPSTVYIREVIGSDRFRRAGSPLTIALGKDASGDIFCADLAAMPHLLIAGATGSGKSVCINVIIASLLFRCDPRDVRLVLVDPKKLELSLYARLERQHLVAPSGLGETVITTAENAVKTLQSVHAEMERRYDILAEAGVRGLGEYNEWIQSTPADEGESDTRERLPHLVVIIDELADLMMLVRREFEDLIVRLAQMSRAVGIHLVVATQRPSVDVVTGLIKANFPARIAFQVAAKPDSRTILDCIGAEALLGRGDMLFHGQGTSGLVRLHGALISTREVENIVEFVRAQPPCDSSFRLPDPEVVKISLPVSDQDADRPDTDELFDAAAKIIVQSEQGSISVLQRRLKVGYARAARLIDQLEQAGIVGPFDGSKARQVIATPEELRERYGIE